MVPEHIPEYPGPLLHEIFEAQAAVRPNDVAVVFGRQTATYGEMDRRANQLARHLRRKGVRRGTTVGLLAPRSINAYISILGILKAGAAYVPIDPEYPVDRMAWILEDCTASALVTVADVACPAFHGAVVRIDAQGGEIAGENPAPLPHDDSSAGSRDLCYVIYTSGSTGRPRGVMVEHRNVCHLVKAEAGIFGVRRDDRVYQGAPLSFDLSVEEIWLAFGAGATLVAVTPETTRAGPDLSRQLAELGVTVLSSVPTLLAMLNPEVENLPALRLLILGGEACSSPLIARWVRPGRRIVNTYGPTEATVIATYADVFPGKPVTIGRAVPGYHVYLLDDELRPVPRGETGEICIGGAGVARGYRGLPDETDARFVPDPFALAQEGARMYRSGDMGSLDAAGNIQFMGRADGQVKLRGYRVELGEIESALLRDQSVGAAACALRENARGEAQLIGYVVPRNGHVPDGERLRSQLRTWLPAWMVPSLIESVGDLPRLPSGKLDRASLPEPRVRPKLHGTLPPRPEDGSAGKLMEVWNALFRPLQVSPDDDFFLDLGGHSLLAAMMVSELRTDPRFASLTVRDVYQHPTVAQLSSAIDSRGEQHPEAPSAPLKKPGQRGRHFAAGIMQSASLYFVFGFRGVQWITPFLVYSLLIRHHSGVDAAFWALGGAVAVLPVLILIAVLVKWVLLGRVQAGRYPLWGGYYLRWWFVQTLIQSLPLTVLGGTPLLPLVYRVFGARIGKDVHIATDLLAAFDLISIGDGASVDEGASLLGHTVESGELAIGPVSVGRNGLVGTRSVMCPGAVLEDNARLEDLSLLSSGARIPAGETWSGSPARFLAKNVPSQGNRPARRWFHRIAITALYAAVVLAFPLIELSAFLPGVAILTRLNPAQALFYLAAPVVGLFFIVCVTAEVALIKWLLMGRAHAGRYPVHGWFYIRNWVVEQLLALSVDVAGPLHATLFLKSWYRALGAKLGRYVELSTAITTTPDLLDIADDCFVADDVSLGAARVEGGWLTLAPTRLGRRAFVGNGAVIPAGTTLGAGSLVGVLTVAPGDQKQSARVGACWLGSPPLFLPRRQSGADFPEQATYRPTRWLQWARGCWELLRMALPGAGFIVATVGVLEAALRLWDRSGPAATLLALPAIFAACCLAVMVAVVPIKWIVVGRYQTFERPFWSAFVWRWEFVNALFEFMATPIGLEALRGTPLLPWYLRLLGCGIGRQVYIDTTGFIEFDLVDVGDRAMLNRDSILQTHLFEDRVLKGSGLRVGADCEIGTQSIILYDTEMKDGARVGALSLVMKGEVLPAGPVWVGSPLTQVGDFVLY
ncbi:MAG: Pls/PosA family non-ribosomal peptide synthetase [Bryobacteraceae bacterium]|jgi:non-ribosomal peptide synthetase-like protein